MTKAIFTAKRLSAYDDDPSVRYHFPRTYLKQAEQAVGDLVLYYEPRRVTTDLASSGGLQSYFAAARLDRIEPDPHRPDLFYGYVDSYVDFDSPVRFDIRESYLESSLQKSDGSTNKGAFGRAVRLIPDREFEAIVRHGFSELALSPLEAPTPMQPGFAEPPMTFERPVVESLVSRPFRDRVFTRQVQSAYGQRCAVTGIRLINGGGKAEAQAAHIRPVADKGPDSVRNGLALSGTIHWMFDRGLLTVDDDFRLLKARSLLPEGMDRLFHPSGKLLVPEAQHLQPHPQFLRYHRDNVFKG